MSVEELLQRSGKRWMTRALAESPDDVLVVAAILGDLAAFDQLVLRYRAAVVRVAQGIVGREHAGRRGPGRPAVGLQGAAFDRRAG